MVNLTFPIANRTLWFITLALTGFVLISSAWVFPNFESAEVQWGDKPPEPDPWPWVSSGDAEAGPFSITLQTNLPPIHPRRFLIVADDKLRGVEINGQPVGAGQLPITFDNLHPASLDLGERLKPGRNEIRFSMINGDGPAGLRLHIHPLDPLCLVWTSSLILLAALGILLLGRSYPSVFGGRCAIILFAGIALRILYWAATPYYLRAYDWGGHIQFLKYAAEHLALPPADLGWETHQPPLYYVFGGLWMRLTGQASSSWLYGQWSSFALLLSVASLILSALISHQLFRGESGAKIRCSLIAITAFFPALIFHATRISNDVLFAFLCFLWLWLLLRWWESPSWRRWMFLSGCVGLAFLVKNGALVLAAATAACAVLRLKSPAPVAKAAAILALAVLLLSGWHQIPKAISAASPSSFVVGNIHRLDKELRIPGNLGDLTVFNPVEIVNQPFNHPWLDDYRRRFFPEYFFKSALFGEWPWGQHLLLPARALALAAFALLAVSFVGLLTAIRDQFWASGPLIIASGSMIAAQVAYVLKEAFSCNQDFRFFVVLTLPLAAFAALGASRLPGGNVVIAIFCAASAGFILPLLYA